MNDISKIVEALAIEMDAFTDFSAYKEKYRGAKEYVESFQVQLSSSEVSNHNLFESFQKANELTNEAEALKEQIKRKLLASYSKTSETIRMLDGSETDNICDIIKSQIDSMGAFAKAINTFDIKVPELLTVAKVDYAHLNSLNQVPSLVKIKETLAIFIQTLENQ